MFNAVNKFQQKEKPKEKTVTKTHILEDIRPPSMPNEEQNSKKWSIFDENYLLSNQKLKDWDKKTQEEQQMEEELEGEIEGVGFDDW